MIKKTKKMIMIPLSVLGAVTFAAGASVWNNAVKASAEGEAQSVLSQMSAFSMKQGASVRVQENSDRNGIRFSATVSKTDYDYLEGLETGAYKVTYGMLIAPIDYVREKELSETNVFGENAVYTWAAIGDDGNVIGQPEEGKTRIVNLTYDTLPTTEDETGYEIKGSLTKIKEENLTKEFVGRAYVAYTNTETGAAEYRMAEYADGKIENNARSVTYVAQLAYEDPDSRLTAGQKQKIKTAYIDKVSAVKSNYTVETYLKDGKALIRLNSEKKASTIGASVNEAAEHPGFRLVEEESNAQGTVYANDKLTLKLVYEYTDDAQTYCVTNGGFETGDLTGWTIASREPKIGDVSSADTYWKEGISFNKDGEKLFSCYAISDGDGAIGTLTSSTFTVGGSGWITFKLGGAKHSDQVWLDVVDADSGEILRRFGNPLWKENTDGVKSGCTLNAYKANLSDCMGKAVYLRLVDNATSDYGVIFADSFETYHFAEPSDAFFALATDITDRPATVYDLYNGGFEKETLVGWTKVGDIGDVSNADNYWIGDKDSPSGYSFNKDGDKFFSCYAEKQSEGATGTLTSSPFVIGGSGWVTYKLGAAKNSAEIYIEVRDYVTEEVLGVYGNHLWKDRDDLRGCTMIAYKADLSAYKGRTAYFRLVDNATTNYGLFFVDSFNTYYAEEPSADFAVALDTRYNVQNGGFETGDLTGWTYTQGTENGQINGDTAIIGNTAFWAEEIPYNQGGDRHFDGWQANATESYGYTVRSNNFVLSGSGYISFKIGGKGHIKVYKADGTQIAEYTNTEFKNENFPSVANGCRLGTMITYVADLHDWIGESLYIELCDIAGNTDGGWDVAFFDDIVTYYKTAPVIGDNKDIVEQGGVKTELPWVAAVNQRNSQP